MVNEGLSDSRFSLGLEYEPKNQIEPLREMAQRYLNQSNGDPFDLINDEGIQTLLRTPELIRIIDFNYAGGTEGKPIYEMAESEPDKIIFQIPFPAWGIGTHPEWMKPRETPIPMEELLTALIGLIFTYDCTGCCNTFKYITFNSAGIMGYADLGGSYHS